MKRFLIAASMAFTLAGPVYTGQVLAKDVMDVADLVEQQGPAVVNVSTTKLVKRNGQAAPFVIPGGDEQLQESA